MRFNEFNIKEARTTGPDDGTRGGREPDEETQGFDGVKSGPPYPKEDMENVKAMQRKLKQLGYSVGSTGVDGKYGPRTTRAVRAYKKDNNIDTPSTMLTASEFAKLLTAKKVDKPTPVSQSRGAGRSEDLGGLASLDNLPQAKQTVEEFLGREVSNNEMNYLIRAVASEASPNAQERGAVAAVILNRARSSRFPSNIINVLQQRNQFQAVTGTRYDPGPSRNFTNMSSSTGGQVVGAIIRYLPRMNKSWLNFTSNIPAAYGRGTNIDFMYAMRDAPGAEVIGGTVFGRV